MYFPVFLHLETSGYGLYPGLARDGIFQVAFSSGLTVVLGANGLGKSTLVNLLYRMLTGPSDISLPEGNVGTSSLKEVSLGRSARTTFSARVHDGAAQATATLRYSIGDKEFTVERSLADLTLRTFSIDHHPSSTSEDALKAAILDTAGVNTFGEWIFLLRTMIFFFEDRRQLVWDPTAQRQLLRCLLLPRDQAHSWTEAERSILEIDTRMRNLNAALSREEFELRRTEKMAQTEPEVREQLVEAEATFKFLTEQQIALATELEELDKLRGDNRLDSMRAQEQLSRELQELERARLYAIESRFPTADESMRYIFSRLMADELCLVCQTPGRTEKRVGMLAAIDRRQCVFCDAQLLKNQAVEPLDAARIETLQERLRQIQETSNAAKHGFEATSAKYAEVRTALAKCTVNLANVRDRLGSLENRLPPDTQKRRSQAESLAEVKGKVAELRGQLREQREAFSVEMTGYRTTISDFSERIKSEFDAAANGFLLERASLSWAPVRVPIGQAGLDGLEPVEYPAFAVEMTGAGFTEGRRRNGPEQVSESQREFIDLAFRMALVKVVATDGAATILVDAPESSLDAVFVGRAAYVLTRFANENALNRLIVTSNLAAGRLIPELLKAAESTPVGRLSRIVDLFELGAPTRAMVEMQADYDRLRAELRAELSEDQANAG